MEAKPCVYTERGCLLNTKTKLIVIMPEKLLVLLEAGRSEEELFPRGTLNLLILNFLLTEL
jgi:hypothetical protein